MKRRWLVYALVGVVFGVLDWHIVQWSTALTAPGSVADDLPEAWLYAFNSLVWLVPLLPVACHAAKTARAWRPASLAGSLTWGTAVISYYAYYGLRLALGGVPGWEHLNVFGGKETQFWEVFWQAFKPLIFFQILEWLWVALLGGFVLGALVWKVRGGSE